MSELETWLQETKAKNLSLDALKINIEYLDYKLWLCLEGTLSEDKAEILFNQWQKEPEFSPKRGDRVLVWDDNETEAIERIFLEYIKGSNYPYIVVSKSNEKEFIENKKFGVTIFRHMKPLPTETDFKSSELLYTEKDMIEYSSYSLKLALEIIETRKVPLILSPEQWKKEEKQL